MPRQPQDQLVISVPNLVQGVSQQSAPMRRDSQCESQFDCINDASDGCVARPPFETIRVFGSDKAGWGSTFFSETFDDEDNYLCGIRPNGEAFAIDLSDGTDCTIINSAGAEGVAYVTSGSETVKAKLRAHVVDDYTFITNRLKQVAMASTTSAAKLNEALVFVRNTTLNTTMSVIIDGTVFSVDTPGDNYTSTRKMAVDLKDLIDLDGDYTTIVTGSVLRIKRVDNAAFTISTRDGAGDTALLAFYRKARHFTDLPNQGFDGYKLQVSGESRTVDDNYYLEYDGDGATGEWVEVVGWNVKTNLDATTMPFILERTGYREFTFKKGVWSSRIAGDDNTSPLPSFVGKFIRDISFHNKRLMFLTRSSFVYSKAFYPFTWFPDTVQTKLADAPIDYTLNTTGKRGSSILDFAVGMAESLYIWAQKVQYKVSSGSQSFKQENIQADGSTGYTYSDGSYPMVLSGSVYFPTTVGNWTTVRSIQFNGDRLAGDVDVTAHVQKYIPAGVRSMTGSDTLRSIFVPSDGDNNVLCVFDYTFDGQQFVQAAWNKWRLPGGAILWAGMEGSILRVLQVLGSDVTLLKCDLTSDVPDVVSGISPNYKVRLDHRVTEAQVSGLSYNSTTNRTSFTVPYDLFSPIDGFRKYKVICAKDYLRAASGSDPAVQYRRGQAFEVYSVVGRVVTVTGNLTSLLFYAGYQIVSERTESRFYLRGDAGAEPVDRLSINNVLLEYSETGYTRLEAFRRQANQKYYEEWQGLDSDLLNSYSDKINLATGKLRLGVNEVTEEITIRLVNDSVFPSKWQSLSYDVTPVGWKGVK